MTCSGSSSEAFQRGHAADGRRLWACSHCGRVDVWSDSWISWGSLSCRQWHEPCLKFIACSEACMDALSAKHGINKEQSAPLGPKRPRAATANLTASHRGQRGNLDRMPTPNAGAGVADERDKPGETGIRQGGAAAACRAHNPEVVRSNRTPATKVPRAERGAAYSPSAGSRVEPREGLSWGRPGSDAGVSASPMSRSVPPPRGARFPLGEATANLYELLDAAGRVA